MTKKTNSIEKTNIVKKKNKVTFVDYLLDNWAFYTGLFILLAIYFLLYTLLGQSVISKGSWNSYTLQAQAWWEGKAHLAENYSYLELAVFNNQVFVSFPPIPTIVMFILYPFFGMDIPDNTVTSMYMVISYVIMYKVCVGLGKSDFKSAFWSLFLVAGNNIFTHSVNGGVWFQAQSLSFMLSCLALYFIIKKKSIYWHLAFLMWALSIGCRPLQVAFVPILLYLLYQNIKKTDKDKNFFQVLLSMIKFAIAPVIVALFLGWYNYIRFGNPLEFGHKYLAEHINNPTGSFNIKHFSQNLPNIFRLPTIWKGQIYFERFNGWAFYLANPFYIAFFIYWVKSIVKKFKIPDLILVIVALHISLTLLYLSLGGSQFGIRYLADGLMYMLFYMMYSENIKKQFENKIFLQTEKIVYAILMVGAIVLQFYGCLITIHNL